jgi:hypothetical protein
MKRTTKVSRAGARVVVLFAIDDVEISVGIHNEGQIQVELHTLRSADVERIPVGMKRRAGADLERSFRVLRSLPADIWVTSHARVWGRYRKFVDATRRTTRRTRSSTRGLPRVHRHRRGRLPQRPHVLAAGICGHKLQSGSLQVPSVMPSGDDDR